MSIKDLLPSANEKASANFTVSEIEDTITRKSSVDIFEEFREEVKQAKDEVKVRKLIVCLYILEGQGKIEFRKPDVVKTRLQLNLNELQALIDELESQIKIVQDALDGN
ncbi:MAG: hypothetical protein ACXAEU_09715 [Candidatus Hodarchaeales archaeon]|jgi:hypothetical protein